MITAKHAALALPALVTVLFLSSVMDAAVAKTRDVGQPNATVRETSPPTVREHNQTGPRPNPIVKRPQYPHPGSGYVAPPFQGARDHRTSSQTPRSGGKK
jgi:hypothetical protein